MADDLLKPAPQFGLFAQLRNRRPILRLLKLIGAPTFVGWRLDWHPRTRPASGIWSARTFRIVRMLSIVLVLIFVIGPYAIFIRGEQRDRWLLPLIVATIPWVIARTLLARHYERSYGVKIVQRWIAVTEACMLTIGLGYLAISYGRVHMAGALLYLFPIRRLRDDSLQAVARGFAAAVAAMTLLQLLRVLHFLLDIPDSFPGFGTDYGALLTQVGLQVFRDHVFAVLWLGLTVFGVVDLRLERDHLLASFLDPLDPPSEADDRDMEVQGALQEAVDPNRIGADVAILWTGNHTAPPFVAVVAGLTLGTDLDQFRQIDLDYVYRRPVERFGMTNDPINFADWPEDLNVTRLHMTYLELYPDIANREGLRTGISLVITSGDAILGVLWLAWRQPQFYPSPDMRKYLEVYSHKLLVALRFRKELIAKQEQQARRKIIEDTLRDGDIHSHKDGLRDASSKLERSSGQLATVVGLLAAPDGLTAAKLEQVEQLVAEIQDGIADAKSEISAVHGWAAVILSGITAAGPSAPGDRWQHFQLKLQERIAAKGATARFKLIFPDGLPFPSDLSRIGHLYAAVELAVVNAIRHASGSQCQISASHDAATNCLMIQICDQGPGFMPPKLPYRLRSGLHFMAFHAELAGATLRINSCRGSGCTVQFSLPVEGEMEI